MDKELIYRNDLLAAYDATHKGPPGGARRLIEKAPAVDAAPVVHAKAIHVSHLEQDAKIVFWRATERCSKCLDNICQEWHYCQNCGAKIDGGEPIE